MNRDYYSPTSAFGLPDLDQADVLDLFENKVTAVRRDQLLHGNGLESSEEKALAARRKNAEAQKMYRIRKKEYEQSLEREGLYPIVPFSLDVFLWI